MAPWLAPTPIDQRIPPTCPARQRLVSLTADEFLNMPDAKMQLRQKMPKPRGAQFLAFSQSLSWVTREERSELVLVRRK